VDTHLNWGASYWANDIYDRLYCRRLRGHVPGSRRLVWVARGANVLILVLALAVMTQLGSIQAAWKTSLLFGAGMGVPQLLRWVWHRQNAWGELVPLVLSLVVAPLLLFAWPDDQDDAWRLIVMTVVATGASVVATLVTAPVEREHLDRFFIATDPPGFWASIAHRTGRDGAVNRRRFWLAVLATALASLSVFALIVGLGSWLLQAPGPSGVPSGLWIGGMLAIGFGLIPSWRHVMRLAVSTR